MSSAPLDKLELHAAEQRTHLHESAVELKERIAFAREKFDIRRNAREHFGVAAGAVAAVAFIAGYGLTGMFVRE
jgi:hypothetical protein